jgi:hypothetical protein
MRGYRLLVHFDAFEGPDASTHGKKLLRIEIKRPNQPPYTVDSVLNGWIPDENRFTFGIAEENHRPKSLPKIVLQTLSDNAQSIQLTIIDPVNPKLQLQFIVPVSDKSADFKALLAGLK